MNFNEFKEEHFDTMTKLFFDENESYENEFNDYVFKQYTAYLNKR